jgi:two-component system NtrC family response regulator
MSRILVVEDHADTLLAMQKLLSMSGYIVLMADSLKQAREVLRADTIDLLICDISLTDGNGLELLRETSVKGIVMSGWGLEEDTCSSR